MAIPRAMGYGAVLLLLGLALLAACGAPYELHGGEYNPPREAPELQLTDHNGKPFLLSELRGRMVLLFFGYTHCPDVCPTTLADLRTVRRELGRDAERVQVLFVSVDPERDTAELLKGYVTAFDKTFIGLRGSQEELAPILEAYRVKVARQELPDSALGYTVDHSAFIYVIDPDGYLRERLLHGAVKAEDITADVRHLLHN